MISNIGEQGATNNTNITDLDERVTILENNPSGGAVTSVNDKTGDVYLKANDIEYKGGDTVLFALDTTRNEVMALDTRVTSLEENSGSGGTIQSINDANDVNIDTSKLSMLITDEQTGMVSQADVLKRIDVDVYKAIGSFGATEAETQISSPNSTTFTLLNWANLTISETGINYSNGVFTSSTRSGKINIKAVISGYKKSTYSPYFVILKNGVKIKEVLHQGSANVTSINEIEVADVDFTIGDTFSIGIRSYNTSNSVFVINNVPTTLNLSANGGGTREVIKLEALEEAVATKAYTNSTFLPNSELPNVISHTNMKDLADVSFDTSLNVFQMPYYNPITNQLMATPLVVESLDYNNILVHPVAYDIPYGWDTDIQFNTTPEELDGTLFTPVANGVKINQPTNKISLSGRLTLIGTGIDPAHQVYVSVILMKGNDILGETNATLSNNTPPPILLDSMEINANVNDVIHVKVNYSNNGNNSKLSLNGTGYIRLYNANEENAIKIGNEHLQSDYYVDGTISNTVLTTTDQTILTKQITENITLKSRGIASLIDVTRTGGGTGDIVYFTLFKNGTQIGNSFKQTLRSGDSDSVPPFNVKRYNFSANDTLEVKARYVGGGTATITNGDYSITGFKL